MSTNTRTALKGYALVDSRNQAFGWYRTVDAAIIEQEFQRKVYLTSLRLVKDSEATWPDSPAGSK